MSTIYVCETEISDAEFIEGCVGGTLLPWRIDADGRQWYRRIPDIHGVPRLDNEAGDDED